MEDFSKISRKFLENFQIFWKISGKFLFLGQKFSRNFLEISWIFHGKNPEIFWKISGNRPGLDPIFLDGKIIPDFFDDWGPFYAPDRAKLAQK